MRDNAAFVWTTIQAMGKEDPLSVPASTFASGWKKITTTKELIWMKLLYMVLIALGVTSIEYEDQQQKKVSIFNISYSFLYFFLCDIYYCILFHGFMCLFMSVFIEFFW